MESEEMLIDCALTKYNSLFKRQISNLREKQVLSIKQIVKAVEQDCADYIFVLLQTGYGKTLVVDIARLYLNCVMLGIYPLDSIMIPAYERDLEAGLKSVLVDDMFVQQLKLYVKGVSIENAEMLKNIKMFIKADVDSLHGHPEPYQDKTVLDIFRNENWSRVRLIMFEDEVHLVVKWGNDYRKLYSKVSNICEAFSASEHGMPKVIGASATCTDTLCKEILSLHKIDKRRSLVTKMCPIRSNIFVKVKPFCKLNSGSFTLGKVEHPRTVVMRKELEPIISELKSDSNDFKKTMIFVNRKPLCGELMEMIFTELGEMETGIVVQIHADIPRHIKEETFKAINSGITKLIICTESAGTGADFPGFVRAIHWGAPATMQDFIQHSGRMRCDGERFLSLIIYSNRDKTNPKIDVLVKNMLESDVCRRTYEEKALEYDLTDEEKVIISRFGCCDICSPELEKWPDYSEPKLNFSVGNNEMVSVLKAYFHQENNLFSQLETGLTDALAKHIKKFWRCPDFQLMLVDHLNPHYLKNIRDIVNEFTDSIVEEDIDGNDDDNDSIFFSDESSALDISTSNDETGSDDD